MRDKVLTLAALIHESVLWSVAVLGQNLDFTLARMLHYRTAQ
jgi:hypothetical protein